MFTMSSSPDSTDGSPFAPTVIADSNTLLSIFETKSEMDNRPGPTGSNVPSGFASRISEMSVARTAEQTTFLTSTITASDSISETSTQTESSQASETGFATVTQSATSTSTTLDATVAANSSSSDVSTQSAMSKPGNQAAVAVPIVIVTLAIFGIIFFCLRRQRRRRSQDGGVVTEKDVGTKNKNWTRHLRVFSFDNELLMGGRYSSTNSIRSRQTGSVRSNQPVQHAASPSLHSIEEVAPAYRDAVRPTPNIGQVMAGGAVGRSESTATAPPPYAGAVSRPISPESHAHETRNPFADSPLVSPVEDSPFDDPSGISRNSSLHNYNRDDVSSIAPSDAASIREATMVRNASVMSRGRIIQNVRHDSQ